MSQCMVNTIILFSPSNMQKRRKSCITLKVMQVLQEHPAWPFVFFTYHMTFWATQTCPWKLWQQCGRDLCAHIFIDCLVDATQLKFVCKMAKWYASLYMRGLHKPFYHTLSPALWSRQAHNPPRYVPAFPFSRDSMTHQYQSMKW